MAQNGRPDIGACSGIPDLGAWQFVIPDGLKMGTLESEPTITGAITSTSAVVGKLGARIVIEGKFGADQS